VRLGVNVSDKLGVNVIEVVGERDGVRVSVEICVSVVVKVGVKVGVWVGGFGMAEIEPVKMEVKSLLMISSL